MSMMSKRIPALEVHITPDGRNHGDTQMVFELDSKKLVVREVKGLLSPLDSEIDLSDPNVKTDILLSSSYGQTDGSAGAVTGAVLFGAAGAVAGVILGKGKDFWIFEVATPERTRIFKLQRDMDKKPLEKYIAKFK